MSKTQSRLLYSFANKKSYNTTKLYPVNIRLPRSNIIFGVYTAISRLFKQSSITTVVILATFLLYSYNLHLSYSYHPDFARDLFEIIRITQGRLTLLGPKLTFGGLYTGPYYFYLFAPVFWLTKGNILSIVFFNSLLFAISIGYFFKKTLQNYSPVKAFLAAACLALLPFMLTSARDPYNSYSYLPFLIGLLTYIYYHHVRTPLALLIVGILMGVITNFHFVNLLLIPAISLLLVYRLPKKVWLFYFLIGFSIPFLPLLIFEVRHNFVMITNTFIHRSYQAWTSNSNIPDGPSGKANPFVNLWFLSQQLSLLLYLNPLLGLGFVSSLSFIKSPSSKTFLLLTGALLNLVVFALVLRFQFIPHYIFSLALFTTFAFIIILLNSRLYWLLAIYIIWELIFFPVHIYRPSPRPPELFRSAVQYVIDHQLIEPNENFNLIQITQQNLMATIGFEYRFFFQKSGYLPDSEFAYQTSPTLLVFSEIPDYDLVQHPSWELDQFGRSHLESTQKFTHQNLTIYKISKN